MAKGFKAGGGGGANPLNFKVVGNPKPASPVENTIWLNTDVPIPKWYFDYTQPENMAEGDVWFPIGTSSPVEFNALKKHNLQVYPISAKQHVSGALVDVEAKTYQNGEWVDWIVILVDGSYLSNRYGEWMGTNYGGTGGTVSYTENGISVKANAGDNSKYGGGKYAGPSETINFDDINEIHFIIANNTSYSITAQLLITSVKDTSYTSSTVATSNTAIAPGSEAEVLFDTSAVTGNYYLRFGCSTSKTTTSSRTLVFRKIFWGGGINENNLY